MYVLEVRGKENYFFLVGGLKEKEDTSSYCGNGIYTLYIHVCQAIHKTNPLSQSTDSFPL